MNRKINTICFIFLFLFLICAVSAAESENETLTTISESDTSQQNICTAPDEATLQNDNVKPLESKQDVDKTPISATKTVKKKVTIKAPNVSMHYKDGHKFTVTVKDENKKAISKAKVKISINGATYNKVTDSKGTASINLNLKSGNYIVMTTFDGTSQYEKQSVKSTVNIKSTIKCSDFTKYYKNTATYSSTFYDNTGKLLKSTQVKFKINNKHYSVKTNAKGVAKIDINLKPGKYSISSINSKTSETIVKSLVIKSLIETKDLTMTYNDKSKFNVKVVNIYGKASPNKKVTLKVNGKTYTKTTDKTGTASLPIDLKAGTYTITTEYDGLKATNKIIVKKEIKKSLISHITLIPNYVNVTCQYVFHNSYYSLKTGLNGIIRMPKNELFTIQINETTGYLFTKSRIAGIDSIVMGYKSYLIPFNGSAIRSDINKENLNGNGIIISSNGDYTEIEYRNVCENNTELFGVYADKGLEHSETITYMQNNKIKAKVNFYTISYDESGLRYSLAKFYSKSIYDFNYKSYDEITNNNAHLIKFANTNEPVTFNYFGRSIVGYSSKEEIITKFVVDRKEELEKTETISYGLSEKYRKTFGFEVLQSFAIINEEIDKKIVENWVSKNSNYLNKFGVMNVYGMFLASLETAWLADELANNFRSTFNVDWKRDHTLTILGGINLDDTYLHILNADMGMTVEGKNETNEVLFRLLNSIYLPLVEEYSLCEVAKRYMYNTTNSFDSVFSSIANNNFSICQLGDSIYLFAEDSAIILNCTTGVANLISVHENNIYKGCSIGTSNDCCNVGIIPKDIIKGIEQAWKYASPAEHLLSTVFNKIHPLSVLTYKGLVFLLGKALDGASSAGLGMLSTMALVQQGGTYFRDNMISEKDWHTAMDSVAFTRPGYLQSKKVYNIPNENGGYDYIEVKINDDLTLDRTSARYISKGQTKQLSKEETYQYFNEETWTPFSMPSKYWDESWKGA